MGQDTGGWKKESLCVKAKENGFILCFPPAEDVWPFPRKWASVGRVVAPEEKHLEKNPIEHCNLLLLSLRFYC